MAPKKFRFFPKLPLELRRRIWNLTLEPRVIRAKWENNHFNEKEHWQLYVLAAGPVPSALHVHKESRDEAKRRYSHVKSRLPFHSKKTLEPHSIWVNLEIDTIYFVNFPSTNDFLSWMRRFTNKRNGGGANKEIKHIAIHASVLHRLAHTPHLPDKTGFIYQLVAEHPTLKDITIMLDNSKFEDDPRPHAYTISDAKPLGPLKRGGGRWGCYTFRSLVAALFDNFFTQAKVSGAEWEKFRKFRENSPQWIEPSFPMMSISKSTKVMARYRSPLIPQRLISGAKFHQAGPQLPRHLPRSLKVSTTINPR